MTADIIALALTAVISIVIPLIILGVVWKKSPMERGGIMLCFCIGVVIYIVMQWGIKEHGLQYLFNHSRLSDFMNHHYIPYLLVVAFAGAMLSLIPEVFIVIFVFKRQMSFAKAAMMALGYAMMESVILVGYRCIYTIVMIVKEDAEKLGTATGELFLSGYERILFMIIHVAVMVALVYFVEQNMGVRGSLIALFCHALFSFLPGFFLAFTTKNYTEVFDRTAALTFSYIVLTMGAVAGLVVINALKYTLKDERIDSKQAVLAYQKRQEEKKKKKAEKNCTEKNS